jgi:UDP-N-acetyl-D-mannosaminuronic acid dehydrogenase
MKKQTIGVVGLGYVGLTLAIFLANKDKNVIGIDSRKEVVDDTLIGKTSIFDEGLGEALISAVNNKNLIASQDKSILSKCDYVFITVGTQLSEDSNTFNDKDLSSLVYEISKDLKENAVIILRSTVSVGTTRKIYDNLNKKIRMGFCPERTAEGVALKELQSLPQICSAIDLETLNDISNFFNSIGVEVVQANSVEEAELSKLMLNSYRDLKFAFSNEVALSCQKHNISLNSIIDISNFNYPRGGLSYPGPVGGPCLTKDSFFLNDFLLTEQPSLPVSGRKINSRIITETIDLFLNKASIGKDKKISIFGMAFKGHPETGDLRGSAGIEAAELLYNLGYSNIWIHDFIAELESDRFVISRDVKNALEDSSLIIFTNNNKRYQDKSFLSELSLIKNSYILDFSDILKKDVCKNIISSIFKFGEGWVK